MRKPTGDEVSDILTAAIQSAVVIIAIMTAALLVLIVAMLTVAWGDWFGLTMALFVHIWLTWRFYGLNKKDAK